MILTWVNMDEKLGRSFVFALVRAYWDGTSYYVKIASVYLELSCKTVFADVFYVISTCSIRPSQLLV